MKNDYPIISQPLPAGIKCDVNVQAPMRDGVKLAMNVYRPEKEGKYPVILSISPYIKEIQHMPPHLSHYIEAGATGTIVPRGYVHVIASIRGTGFSQGQYGFMDATEQQDGYDLIEWIAKQPWCDGNVGMYGDSYFAVIQYLWAAQQPPSLKCIAPYDGWSDLYRDVVHQGGIFWTYFMGLWALDMIHSGSAWPGNVEGKLPPSNFLTDVCFNAEDGPYWYSRSSFYLADRIKVPTLNAVPLSPLHSRGQLSLYQQLKGPKKLMVTPRTEWYANVFFYYNKPFNEYVLRWFDYWLKGIDNGIMDEPEVLICDSGTNQWRYEHEYPLARTEWTKFYLRSNPLTMGPATEPPYGLISDDLPQDNASSTYEFPQYHKAFAGKPAVAFSSAPFKDPLTVQGPLSITLFASTTAIDTAWFVQIGDVAPDGNTRIISHGQLKASFRKVDESKSAPGQPYHSFQGRELPEADEIYEYQIEMFPFFHTFKPGHKIWVQIASDDYNYQMLLRGQHVYEAQPSTGVSGPARNTIYYGEKYPSHLLLPVIPGAPEIRPVESPASDIGWPCKEWPYAKDWY